MKTRKILKNKRIIKDGHKIEIGLNNLRKEITKDFKLAVKDHLDIMIKNIFNILNDHNSKSLVDDLVNQLESQKDKFKDEHDFIVQSCAIFDAAAASMASDVVKRFSDDFDKQLREKMKDGSWLEEKIKVIKSNGNRFINTLAEA